MRKQTRMTGARAHTHTHTHARTRTHTHTHTRTHAHTHTHTHTILCFKRSQLLQEARELTSETTMRAPHRKLGPRRDPACRSRFRKAYHQTINTTHNLLRKKERKKQGEAWFNPTESTKICTQHTERKTLQPYNAANSIVHFLNHQH